MALASDIVDLASLLSAQIGLLLPPPPQPCHSTSPESFLISASCNPAEWTALEYATVNQAIALVEAQGPGAMPIKRDLQDAFRHTSIARSAQERQAQPSGTTVTYRLSVILLQGHPPRSQLPSTHLRCGQAPQINDVVPLPTRRRTCAGGSVFYHAQVEA
jgi:hypothetical protein